MIGSNLFKSDPSQDPSGKRDSDPRPPPWQGGALPLSYFRNACQKNLSSGKRDSDPRPPPWQGGALPLSYFRNACQKNLSSGKRDSNPRPRPWEGRALPTELFPPLRTAVAHGAYRTANIACLIFSTKFFFASPPLHAAFPSFLHREVSLQECLPAPPSPGRGKSASLPDKRVVAAPGSGGQKPLSDQ